VLAGQHLAALCVTATRQAADTRVFGGVYARLVAGTVLDQRGRGVPAGTVAARSGMSREFVDFFEIHLPALVRAGFSVAGAALALFWFDPSLVGDCLLLLVPAGVLNWWYGRRTLALSRRLHGELENEVGVIEEADAVAVRGHYRRVAGWWVRMSDAEAVNVGLMELFVLGLVVVSLVRYCGRPGVSAGEIFAVLRYVLMFVTALDALPGLVRHVSRLRDIAGRVA
jgi:hypothetical protein